METVMLAVMAVMAVRIAKSSASQAMPGRGQSDSTYRQTDVADDRC
ncbi:MAG: hypothetical protein KJO31_12510 [Gammaproteobacteria bacterium]|nr:hypothetical protein [Gammaproteobacteria bacterium]